MSDTRRRWKCGCGSFRFKIAGVDRHICQGCGNMIYKGTALWFSYGKEEDV